MLLLARAPEGYLAIPEIDVRASAGPEALNEGLEETKEMWIFPDPVIRHEFRAQPADLRMITIGGDSMEPLLASVGRILIDTSQRIPGFGLEALNDALEHYGKPEIFNSDQGSQFTSLAFTGVLNDAGVAISMDGRGRCLDNVFIERLWRSLKYEAVYLHELNDGFVAERVIGEWIGFYNTERPHSSLGGQTPAEAYHQDQPVDMMDKPSGLPTSPPAQQQQKYDINFKKNLAA